MLKTLSYRCKKKTLNKIVFKLLGKKIIIDHFWGDSSVTKSNQKNWENMQNNSPYINEAYTTGIFKNYQTVWFSPLF